MTRSRILFSSRGREGSDAPSGGTPSAFTGTTQRVEASIAMPSDIEQFRRELAALGERIDAKVEELRKQGVLHGAARQEAAELRIRRARVSKAAAKNHATVARAISEELAIDVEILRHTFDRWIAQIDRASER
jgi:hypothetical protein